MKNNRPPILQFHWSIASRHGRIIVIIVDLVIADIRGPRVI